MNFWNHMLWIYRIMCYESRISQNELLTISYHTIISRCWPRSSCALGPGFKSRSRKKCLCKYIVPAVRSGWWATQRRYIVQEIWHGFYECLFWYDITKVCYEVHCMSGSMFLTLTSNSQLPQVFIKSIYFYVPYTIYSEQTSYLCI